jgi:hypothetical protein
MMKNTKTVAMPTVLTDAKTIEGIAYNIVATAQIQPSMSEPADVSLPTSREELIASRLITGTSECNSPVVILPLAHSLIFAGDKQLSPVHSPSIRQR